MSGAFFWQQSIDLEVVSTPAWVTIPNSQPSGAKKRKLTTGRAYPPLCLRPSRKQTKWKLSGRSPFYFPGRGVGFGMMTLATVCNQVLAVHEKKCRTY